MWSHKCGLGVGVYTYHYLCRVERFLIDPRLNKNQFPEQIFGKKMQKQKKNYDENIWRKKNTDKKIVKTTKVKNNNTSNEIEE